MKILYAGIILLSLFSDTKDKSELYCNDRFGYTSVELEFFADSTYTLSRWNHMGSINDNGNWKKSGDLYILKSSRKTRSKGRGGKSKRAYIFINDTLQLTAGDTLRVKSMNARTKRVLYDLEYKLFKCPDN